MVPPRTTQVAPGENNTQKSRIDHVVQQPEYSNASPFTGDFFEIGSLGERSESHQPPSRPRGWSALPHASPPSELSRRSHDVPPPPSRSAPRTPLQNKYSPDLDGRSDYSALSKWSQIPEYHPFGRPKSATPEFPVRNTRSSAIVSEGSPKSRNSRRTPSPRQYTPLPTPPVVSSVSEVAKSSYVNESANVDSSPQTQPVLPQNFQTRPAQPSPLQSPYVPKPPLESPRASSPRPTPSRQQTVIAILPQPVTEEPFSDRQLQNPPQSTAASRVYPGQTALHIDTHAVVNLQSTPFASQTPISPRVRSPVKMTTMQVPLTGGHFIVDVALSSEYLNHVTLKEGDEFTKLKYTAATTSPDDFARTYTLRQKALGRKTRIAVVCTMYAEDDILFTKTMSAVMDNIAYLSNDSSNAKGWGPNSWQEIVVVIVSDGRSKVNQKTLDVLSVMGCYMDGLARASVNNSPVTAHVFEFSTQVRVNSHLVTRFSDQASTALPIKPMQTIFLLKEKNAKKINSHRWFFKAVCEQLNPEVCILIDVGTKPTVRSFYHLYRAFERNSNVAGACGEIAADLGRYWRNLLNPLVAVQNFEYKMSNILDKPLESMFGYISVLPGAFSAYRYSALLGRPLEMYFKGEAPHGTNVAEANMYLAEDRILAFELVMKAGNANVMKYVKAAKAETDVPSEFHDLIKQRRRWLNGSFFASVHALVNTPRIFSSGHSAFRKLILFIEAIYNGINLLFSWFNIGNMYLSFYFLFNIAGTDSLAACSEGIKDVAGVDPFYPYGGAVSGVLRTVYLGSLMAIILVSLGNRPEATKTFHITFAIVFACIMLFMMFMGAWTIAKDILEYQTKNTNGLIQYMHDVPNFTDLVVSVLSTYVLYVFSSILALDPWHAFTCMFQYLFMIPSFTNILMVYAFCNIHDVSWGTKGITQATDLPAVVAAPNENGQHVTTVELPSQKSDDANEYYKTALHTLDHEAAHLFDRKSEPAKDTRSDEGPYQTAAPEQFH